MGLNTPAIILNDMLWDLEGDACAGKTISDAVQGRRDAYSAERIGVKVLPCGHSSGVQIVAVGGNTIRFLGWSGDCHDDDETLLRKLADQLGFNIVPKRGRKRPA